MAIGPYDDYMAYYGNSSRRCPPPPHCSEERCMYEHLYELKKCVCRTCYEDYRYIERQVQRGYYRGFGHRPHRTEERTMVQYIGVDLASMSDSQQVIFENRKVNLLGDGKMNIVQKVKALALNADDKLLRKYGVTDQDGDLTDEGREILDTVLLEQFKAQIVEKVKAVAEEEKGKK